MMELLVTLFERRKRYSFQMVKLVYLFPDDTFSENISVNSYDRLFYQDEANQYNLYVEDIHSLKCNYSDQEIIEKVFSQNAIRFLEKTFK